MDAFTLVALVLAGIASVTVGIFVLVRDKSSSENISFFGISMGIFCWALGIAGFLLTDDFDTALMWAKFYYFAPIILVLSAIVFAIRFAITIPIPKWLLVLLFFTGATLAALLLVIPTFLTSHIVEDDYGKRVVLGTVAYSVYGVYLLLAFAVTLAIMWLKSGRLNEFYQRQQARMFFVGFGTASLLGLYFNLILPFFGNYSLIMIGPVCTTIFVSTTAYAIAKHHMFDIRAFVVRTVIYALSTILLALTFVAPIVICLFLILEFKIEATHLVVAVVIITLTATNYAKIRAKFDKITAKIFFRDVYEPAKLLSELNQTLASTIELKDLLAKTTQLIDRTIRPEFCVFYLNDEKKEYTRAVGDSKDLLEQITIKKVAECLESIMDDDVYIPRLQAKMSDTRQHLLKEKNIAAVAQLKTRQHEGFFHIGYMLLGSRKSGQQYDVQDIQVLVATANTLAIAIQNALHFEEIRHFNKTLQERVEEQTRKYRTANEKLKKLDETKDEFISMASHQLRTPLTSVKGYLSMVLEGDAGPLKPQQEQLLKQSFMSSQRMVNLIADLLNLSRLNTGKFVIETAPTDLRVIVDQEIAQLHETAKAKNITLTYVNPKTFSLLPLDEGKIHQVVMNFIDNAIYYTPEGGQIEVSLNETPSHIEFRVQDSGIGVPREMQHKLFGKFYRADNARRMRPDGTGLGLYMAKKVVVAQGGSIIFASQEGKGSTFGFRFSKRHVTTHNQTLPSEKA